MRKLASSQFGGPEVFSFVEEDIPAFSSTQIRIAVKATAMGYVDGLVAEGKYQMKPALPFSPGGEIVGIVDAVGEAVKNIAIGDRVATWQLAGGLAEYVVVEAAEADVFDPALAFETAAAMLLDYQTAHYALFNRGELQAGEVVLVLGAAGGVASAAIQMARNVGAFVVAAASSAEKRSAALAIGANEAIDYSKADWRDALKKIAPDGVDLIVDPVGGDYFEPAFRSLAKGGRHLVIGFAGGPIPSLPANLALIKSAKLVGVDIRYFLGTEPKAAKRVRKALFSLAASGRLAAPKMTKFSFDQGVEALAATMARSKNGKVVVTI